MQHLTREIFDELCEIPTIDAHEHLPTEEAYLQRPRDFFSLFLHYCRGDLAAAGATGDDFAVFENQAVSLAERWTRFRPFLSAIRTGGYARSALLVVRDILGLPDLDDGTYETVSERFNELGKPGLYDRILRERCNLVACIECWRLGESPFPDYFRHLAPSPEVVNLHSREAIAQLGKKNNRSITTLADALDCMTTTVERWRADPTVVGIKSAHAYGRSIEFIRPGRKDAEAVFDRMMANTDSLNPGEQMLLQDFLMYELTDRAVAVDLPMVFHTGLQAGNRNRIRNADPLLLQPLIEAFPNARFDLFHGGMPWVREIAILAKYFSGVHLNMAWMHIISPAQARSALSEWLDLVPNSKIFGFGGDYGIVEKVYGHLTLARQNIAAVLADKVHRGAFSRTDASMVAHRLMFDNPNRFYNLGLIPISRQP